MSKKGSKRRSSVVEALGWVGRGTAATPTTARAAMAKRDSGAMVLGWLLIEYLGMLEVVRGWS